MFIQVIKGRTSDPEGLKRQIDRWQDEIAPGAKGWLGSTSGVAEDGTTIAVVRFESEEAAQSNSDRSEQSAWWAETEKYFDEVSFIDCSEVEEWLAGGSDDAGFVQVMQGTIKDRAKLNELNKQMESMPNNRPDLIGGTTGYHNDGSGFTNTIYFTSEEEARKGEAQDNQNPENNELMKQFGEVTGDITFIDLKQPWLKTP